MGDKQSSGRDYGSIHFEHELWEEVSEGVTKVFAYAKALGSRVQDLRQRTAMTQEQLAELAQVHPTYIAKIEAGDRVPSLEVLYRIAVAVGVSLAQIVDVPDGPSVRRHVVGTLGGDRPQRVDQLLHSPLDDTCLARGDVANLESILEECSQGQIALVMELAEVVKRYHVRRK